MIDKQIIQHGEFTSVRIDRGTFLEQLVSNVCRVDDYHGLAKDFEVN